MSRSRPEVQGISASELVASGRLSSPELFLRWFVQVLALRFDDFHASKIVGEIAGAPVHRKPSKPTNQGLLRQVMHFAKVAFPFFTRTVALNLPWDASRVILDGDQVTIVLAPCFSQVGDTTSKTGS